MRAPPTDVRVIARDPGGRLYLAGARKIRRDRTHTTYETLSLVTEEVQLCQSTITADGVIPRWTPLRQSGHRCPLKSELSLEKEDPTTYATS